MRQVEHTMKKTIRRALILLFVFAVSLIGFTYQFNNKKISVGSGAEKTEEAKAPELPLAYMEVEGIRVNQMFGVRQELREQELRESITPLAKDRRMTFLVGKSEKDIEGITYDVLSIEDGSTVENGQIADLEKKNGMIRAEFSLKASIRNSQEYTLRFTVDMGEKKPVYYYTRVLQAGGIQMKQYLEFTDKFYKICLDKVNSDALVQYLESDDSSPNRSFADLDIHSSEDMVSWGKLQPELAKAAVPKICAVNSTTATVELDYLISAKNSNKDPEYYTVRDIYRMKISDGGGDVSLLNFNRCAELVFESNGVVQTNTGLDLGIQKREIRYASDKSKDIAAFVVNGDLWSYNRITGSLDRIFSFRNRRAESGKINMDARTENRQHNISIQRVAENGDTTFTVYGYMPSGAHEGRMGVSVMVYSVEEGRAEEQIFIPLNQSYSVLDRSISKLSYVNESEKLYLYLGAELCCIDLKNGAYDVVRSGIPSGGFAASESQHTVAWVDNGKDDRSDTATILNLDTEKTSVVKAPAGENIVACGFVNEDFVYGFSRDEDTITDSAGGVTVGMYMLNIRDMDGKILKEYRKDDIYVTGVSQQSTGLELTLSIRFGEGFAPAGTDHIVDNVTKENDVVLNPISYSRTAEKMTMAFPDAFARPDLKTTYAELRYRNAGEEMALEWPEVESRRYYVYSQGNLLGIYDQPNAAVNVADQAEGFVLNNGQQYIWERGDWQDTYTIDTGSLPDGIWDLGFDEQELAQLIGGKYMTLNLGSATQDCMKYYISRGYPVLGYTKDQVYLIIGYDRDNIWVYDRSTGKPKAIASDDSREMFRADGFRFITYLMR